MTKNKVPINVNKNGKIPAINIFQALVSINFAFGKTKVNFCKIAATVWKQFC